jgi:hypothetical protein
LVADCRHVDFVDVQQNHRGAGGRKAAPDEAAHCTGTEYGDTAKRGVIGGQDPSPL